MLSMCYNEVVTGLFDVLIQYPRWVYHRLFVSRNWDPWFIELWARCSKALIWLRDWRWSVTVKDGQWCSKGNNDSSVIVTSCYLFLSDFVCFFQDWDDLDIRISVLSWKPAGPLFGLLVVSTFLNHHGFMGIQPPFFPVNSPYVCWYHWSTLSW